MRNIFKFSKIFLLILLCFVCMFGTCFAEVKGIADLKTAKIGVLGGSTSETLLHTLFDDGDKKAANIIPYGTMFDVSAALRDKKIDAAVMDRGAALFFASEYDDLKILPEPLESVYYAIGFKKGNALVNDVDNALGEIITDGTLADILAKYIDEFPDASEIDLNKNADGGKLWVGCAASFPPYEMRTDKGFIGIDVELCAAIAKKLNKELVIVDYRFDALFDALESGRIDMICSALSVTDERARTIDFSRPYDADQEVILVLDETAKTPEDSKPAEPAKN